MRGLLFAEYLRWRTRPEALALVLLAPMLAALQYATGYLHAQGLLSDSLLGGAPADAQAQAAASFLADFTYPRSVAAALVTGPWLSIAAFIAAALVVGYDFSWGTVRTTAQLAPGRGRLLAARMVTIEALCALMVVGTAAVGLAGPLATHLFSPAGDTATATTAQVAGVLLSTALYAAAGASLAVALRNAATPILVGLVAYFAQFSLASLPVWQDPSLVWVARLLPSDAAAALLVGVQRSAGMLPATVAIDGPLATPWPLNAIFVLGWIMVLTVIPVMLFRRLDLTE